MLGELIESVHHLHQVFVSSHLLFLCSTIRRQLNYSHQSWASSQQVNSEGVTFLFLEVFVLQYTQQVSSQFLLLRIIQLSDGSLKIKVAQLEYV